MNKFFDYNKNWNIYSRWIFIRIDYTNDDMELILKNINDKKHIIIIETKTFH